MSPILPDGRASAVLHLARLLRLQLRFGRLLRVVRVSKPRAGPGGTALQFGPAGSAGPALWPLAGRPLTAELPMQNPPGRVHSVACPGPSAWRAAALLPLSGGLSQTRKSPARRIGTPIPDSRPNRESGDFPIPGQIGNRGFPPRFPAKNREIGGIGNPSDFLSDEYQLQWTRNILLVLSREYHASAFTGNWYAAPIQGPRQ